MEAEALMSLKSWYERVSSIPQETDDQETLRFWRLLPLLPRLKVLDLGCAEGRLSVLLSFSHEVTASDISQGYLSQVPNHVQHTVLADIEEGIEPFNGETFHAVYFMDVIEHLKSPFQALTNIRRLLKPGGVLFINTPNVMSWRQFRLHLTKPRLEPDYFRKDQLTDLHLCTYDYFSLNKLLAFTGFRARLLSPHYFSRNLLVSCRKAEPINIEAQVSYWEGLK